jgi:hypothetical protein
VLGQGFDQQRVSLFGALDLSARRRCSRGRIMRRHAARSLQGLARDGHLAGQQRLDGGPILPQAARQLVEHPRVAHASRVECGTDLGRCVDEARHLGDERRRLVQPARDGRT